METGTWRTIQSEKPLNEIFYDFRAAIEAEPNWSIESYQNPAEIRSQLSTVFAEGLDSDTETEILVLRYTDESAMEAVPFDPIPVVINDTADCTLIATVDFSPESATQVHPGPVKSDIWLEFNEILESVGSVVSVHGGGFHGYRTLRRRL